MVTENQNPELIAVEVTDNQANTATEADMHTEPVSETQPENPPKPERNPAEWVSEHFKWSEFLHSNKAVELGLSNTPNAEERANIVKMAALLEKIRAYLCEKRGRDVGITITSGFRSEMVNRKVGGKKNSAHRLGLAADIRASGFTSKELAKTIHEMESKGLIKYDQLILEYPERGSRSWVHIGLAKGTHREAELTISSRGTFKGLLV